MNHISFTKATWVVAGIVALLSGPLAMAQTPSNLPPGYGPIGPGSQGPQLKGAFPGSSFGTARPGVVPPPQGSHIQNVINQKVPGAVGQPQTPNYPSHFEEAPDPNQDIVVTKDAGEWMILVMTYIQDEKLQAPPWKLARDFVFYLRNNHNIKAYVYSRGREQRLKELARVKAELEKKRAYYKQFNAPASMPIRIKYTRYKDQCAVLIGGFSSDTAASRERDRLRKLWTKPPDPDKVKLEVKFYINQKTKHKEAVYVNPFLRAFVVRNPAYRDEKPTGPPQPDVKFLKRLNRGEPFSLFNAKKPLTLVVKVIQVPSILQDDRESANNIFAKMGFGKKQQDSSAISAHNLAEVLRKAKLEAYVLHTKFSSIVTVGSFDNLNDPRLKTMQELLAKHFRLPPIQLLSTPAPMYVPGRAPMQRPIAQSRR